jgi:hypothetical protein
MIRFIITTFVLFAALNTYSQSTDSNLWIEDIKAYKANLEKHHIDLYHKISKVEFEQELKTIQSNLNSKTDIDVIIDLMRLTQKIGDGHTAFSLRGFKTHLFPIEIDKIGEQWRIVKTTDKHKNLLGKTLIAIDGRTMKHIENEISKVAQYIENKQSKTIRAAQYAMISELLHGLHLTNNALSATFTFSDENKKKTEVRLEAINSKDYYDNVEFKTLEIAIPEIEKPNALQHDFLWFSPIKTTDAIYIKFESYPSFEEMEKFGASVLNHINTNNSKQIVIDLRNNGGGNFFIGTFLAYYLNLADSIDWKSGVYVLTDKVTFSAGTSNASQFRQILNAKIVGEPTGSNPTGYQDMGQFKLPNSGMTITYSKRLFRFQEKVTQGIQPDVFIAYDWQSYSKGIDNMMQWVINDIRKK